MCVGGGGAISFYQSAVRVSADWSSFAYSCSAVGYQLPAFITDYCKLYRLSSRQFKEIEFHSLHCNDLALPL